MSDNGKRTTTGMDNKAPSEDHLSEMGPVVAPVVDRLDVEGEKYSDRTWAVIRFLGDAKGLQDGGQRFIERDG